MMAQTTNTPVAPVVGNAPLLVSIREARRQLGDIGTTAFYNVVKRHGVQLVRLGGRSLVPMAEIERVVAAICTARPANASEKAKALACQSVAARRKRRGDSAGIGATKPATRRAANLAARRRRRGSTEP